MQQNNDTRRGSGGATLGALNRAFYDSLWKRARLIEAKRFNTWPLVAELCKTMSARLEVAPGLRPRLPLEGTQFFDLSQEAVTQLRARGATAATGTIHAVPFAEASFDCVCAFDIVEHVEDDEAAFSELARVSRPGAILLISVPLHAAAWTSFDEFVGHCRRYEPNALAESLRRHGFSIEKSAVYGMQPESSWMLKLGMWFLTHQRRQAMWWYNRVFMPWGLRHQKPLRFVPGLIDDPEVDEIVVVCRKVAGAAR
jgi:SAM-dependent methyltransferase